MKKVLALAVAGALTFAAPAWADREHSTNNTSKKLREAVTVPGIMEHEAALQRISTFNGGNRLSGAPGYDGSANYVAEQAAAAGLQVSRQNFDYDLDLLADYTPPVLSITAGGPARSFIPGIGGTLFSEGDFGSMYGVAVRRHHRAGVGGRHRSRPGHRPEQQQRLSGWRTTRGCRAGAIVLLQDDNGCSLGTKFFGAQAVRRRGDLLVRRGRRRLDQRDRHLDPVRGGPPELRDRAGQRQAAGPHGPHRAHEGRLAAGDLPDLERHRGDARRRSEQRHRRGRAPRQRRRRPGHQRQRLRLGDDPRDRGADRARSKPRNKIRFVWFGAEEHGLLGSEAYVDSLPESERDKIAAMLNFDMVGSPNFVRFVYDGDLSDSDPPEGGAPPASADIEQLFLDYFASQGLPTEPTAFDGRSDYGPFIFAGIPAGGLFTGAEVLKTAEEAAIYGGKAGEPYDPCYHMGCDTIDNLDATALDQMSDAAAHATITLAQTKRLFPSTATAVKTGSGAGPTGGHHAARDAARPLSIQGVRPRHEA